MNEKTAILNVRMLGDFSITYDGRQVSFGKNTTTKAMKLLQILIYYGEQGIAREKLLNGTVCERRTGRCGEQSACDSTPPEENDHRCGTSGI